jgi:type I restriction enzyme S subunit
MITAYPDICEQIKISSFLGLIDKKIEKQQQLVENLKTYKRGAVNKLLIRFCKNSKKVKIGDFSTSFSGGTPKSGVAEYYNGNIPFIRSGEIKQSYTELFLTENGLKNSSAKLVEKGDILYALYGATSGEVAISQINGAINQAILCIRPNSYVDTEFLTCWLENEKQNIISKMLQGGQGNLSADLVKSLEVPLPNYDTQTYIKNFTIKLNDCIKVNETELNALNQIKLYLLQQMFV